MATVTTTTQTDVLSYPHTPSIVRDMSTGSHAGWQFALVRSAATTLTVYRSTDGGGSWAAAGGFTDANIQEWSSFVADRAGNCHLLYRTGTSGGGGIDALVYRRYNTFTQAWGGAVTFADDPNGGTIGSRWTGCDLAVYKPSSGDYYLPWVGGYSNGAGQYGVIMGCGRMAPDGTNVRISNSVFAVNRYYYSTVNPSGHMGPSLEVQHNGDGFTAGTPHLWMNYGRTRQYFLRSAWNGSGWTNPSSSTLMTTAVTAQDYTPGRWDGTQWLLGVVNPADTTTVNVYQRNAANTLTAVFTTPTHPTGVVTDYAVTYDNGTKDIRVLAVGTSTDVLYHVTYVRSTGLWGAWSTVVAAAVLNGGREFGVRRGGSAGNTRIDILTAASGAPNTITNTQQTVASAPAIPTWEYAGVPYVNGGAADVGASLLLDWTFSDPDAGQTQGGYALSRQIGAGAVQYYTAAGGTWGGTEVQNTTGTTQVTLASAWGAGTDANHTYKVKVWDNGGTPATGYSTALILIPSVKVNPAITAPTAAQVISTDHLTVTWTAGEQTSWRLRLLTNPGGLAVYDSGFVVTTDLTYVIPYTLANGTGWTVELTTKNNEGLASTAQTCNFTVVYIEPPAVRSTFVPQPTLGYITVTPVSLAPVGAQPSIVTMALYRRPAITPALNANPSITGNITGYFAGGGGTPGTMTYDTSQFVSSPGCGRYVPPASGGAFGQSFETSSVAIDASKLHVAAGWIRPDTTGKPIQIAINWYDAGSAYISTAPAFAVATPVANAWQFLTIVADPTGVAGAARATVSVGRTGTPLAVDAFYVDEISLEQYDPTTGVRVAASTSNPVNDWGATGGVTYEYQWIPVGSNGTTGHSPWGA